MLVDYVPDSTHLTKYWPLVLHGDLKAIDETNAEAKEDEIKTSLM